MRSIPTSSRSSGSSSTKQAKHLTLTGHWFLPKAVRVNAAWLDGLPDDLRAMVRETAKEAFAEQRKINRAKADEALAELKKLGVQVHELPKDELVRMEKAYRSGLRAVRVEERGDGRDDQADQGARLRSRRGGLCQHGRRLRRGGVGR